MKQYFHLPSPSMAVALLALFVALSGTAWAAANLPKNSVGSKQIKKNAVTGSKVKKSSILGSDLKDATVTGSDVNESTLGTVPTASSATTAGSAALAAAVNPGSIGSAAVQDGSLVGADVARFSGTTSRNFASIPANTCTSVQVTMAAAAGLNLTDDVVLITPETQWPEGLILQAENAVTPGSFIAQTCNVTGGAIDPDVMNFHVMAFDVE